MSNQHPLDLASILKISDCLRQLEEKVHNPITGTFNKCKICTSFKGSVWGADFADKQLISKYDKKFQLFCVCHRYFYELRTGSSFER